MNATAENPANLNIVLDVPVSLTIELGGCQLPMREVLQLNIGSVVQLDKAADAPVELSINGKLIARGEVVVIEERFGVKITEVIGSSNPGDLKCKECKLIPITNRLCFVFRRSLICPLSSALAQTGKSTPRPRL